LAEKKTTGGLPNLAAGRLFFEFPFRTHIFSLNPIEKKGPKWGFLVTKDAKKVGSRPVVFSGDIGFEGTFFSWGMVRGSQKKGQNWLFLEVKSFFIF